MNINVILGLQNIKAE